MEPVDAEVGDVTNNESCVDPAHKSSDVNNLSFENERKIKETYYNKSESKLECKTCKKLYSIKSSHSILKRHIIKTHKFNDRQTEAESIRGKNYKKRDLWYDKIVQDFVIRGTHSFKIVEKEHFIKMIKGLNPTYPGLTRRKLTLNIHRLFEHERTKLIECINSIDKLSLTFDFWTSITNKPYIVITAHFIHKSKLSAITLDFDLIPYPHTSDQIYILTKIKQIFDMYGLQHKIMSITTDNEATNVKLLQLMSLFYIEYEHVIHTRCLAHILNLTVKKGLKK